MTKNINNGYHDTTCEVVYSYEQTARQAWTITARVDYLDNTKDFKHETRNVDFIDDLFTMTPDQVQNHLDWYAFEELQEEIELFATDIFESVLTDCDKCDGTGTMDVLKECGQPSSNCCGGCYEPQECDQCGGSGECTYQTNFENR